VDIRQIADKFPDERGGLKELYDRGPPAAFFLVKFWVNILYVSISVNGFLKSDACLLFCLIAGCNVFDCRHPSLSGAGMW